MEDIVVNLVKKMYVREMFKKGIQHKKENDHMIKFFRDEMFKKVTDTRAYKKKKRISDAKACVNNPDH